MADFQKLKADLQAKAEAERRAAREKECERRYLEQAEELKRSASEGSPEILERIKQMEGRARRAASRYEAAQREKSELAESLLDAWKALVPQTDPRTLIGHWSDDFPILLFPVRLETRFKKVSAAGARSRDELWLRIYPDDCLVDTFEEDLSEMERRNARRYWALHWAALGDEEAERAAWRELVAAHGSGRAGWIRERYSPLNPEEKPVSSEAGPVFCLAIAAQENEPRGAEAEQIATFWKSVWSKEESALNASEMAKKYTPVNLNTTASEGVAVEVVYLRFPEFGEEDSRPFSWSEAPKAKLLPERFVFLGFRKIDGQMTLVKEAITPRVVQSPLAVGPNPSAAEGEQFGENEEGDLIVPEEMKWMTDFEVALEKGMAMRIPLEPELAKSGFDRVFVLGLRLGSDAQEAKAEMEDLIRHHLHGQSGFAIIPQGTPTNNTDDGPSGHSRTDDPDESYSVFVQEGNLFEPTDDPLRKTDGQWLAEWLGLDPDLFQRVPNADQTDQAETRAMNSALWPATMGYWMQRMMDPVFREGNVIGKTRDFFTRYVSGRGHIPAIRIGDQPYGILQATAYRNLGRLLGPSPGAATGLRDQFLSRLYQILMQLDQFWNSMAAQVAHVGKKVPDPQQQLLDIVGLHPSSEEYYARLGHGIRFLYNFYTFAGINTGNIFASLQLDPVTAAKNLLGSLGYKGKIEPKIFDKYYRNGQNRLTGPIVDDRPVSESDPIRAYTEDERNYIGWLIDAIEDYEGALYPQEGLEEIPHALLYKLLRHAMLEAFDNAGHKARFDAAIIDRPVFQQLLAVEPEFLHIKPRNEQSESRVAHLLATEPQIAGPGVPLARHLGLAIKDKVADLAAVLELRQMEDALKILENVPTARLERLLSEHIDICTYRHDAWVQGIHRYLLEQMRERNAAREETGLYLGAFAWLENLRPDNKVLSPVPLSDDLARIFQRAGEIELTADNTNQGYIHAPSLNHAVTAAVLRNGYLSGATPTQPDLLAVNLSSERVRLALETLEGIRNGQSLGALLGYRFERKLHDRDPAMFVFTYQLRKKFPLVANRLAATKDTTEEAQEAIAARNVVDGYALMKKAMAEEGDLDFSFLGGILTDPAPDAGQLNFIRETIRDLLDIHDALSDLGIAESVHQIVQGNYERAAATMDAFSNATFPQVPDVVITPRSGTGLTHRVGLQLNAQVLADPGHTPRARTEPAVNDWLLSVLPGMDEIAVRVTYTNPGDPAPAAVAEIVSLQDLGLQPLDLVYLSDFGSIQALTALDERIVKFLFDKPEVHANAKISVGYTEAINEANIKATLFEIAPLLRHIRLIVLASRPLQPTDVLVPGEASADRETPRVLDRNRIADNLPDIVPLESRIGEWTAAFPLIDQQLDEFVEVCSSLGLYGLTEAGFGFAYNRRQEIFQKLLEALDAYLLRWKKREEEFDQIMNAELPAAGTDEAQIALLRRAEALVSTAFLSLAEPPDLVQYRTDVLTKGTNFQNKYAQLDNLRKNPPSGLQQCMTGLKAQLPLTEFDAEDLVLEKVEQEIERFQQELLAKAEILRQEVLTRLDTVNARLVQHDDAGATPEIRLKALEEAGKVLFGEDFLMVPHFGLQDVQGAEWQNALDARPELLAFQHNTDPFPVDTWFHGLARVREKLGHLEQVYFFTESFGKGMNDLLPTQFPFRRWVPDPEGAPAVEQAEPWLALEFPAHFAPDEEKLLYTAVYQTSFDPGLSQCGLLIDEWTEVIPSREETTGLTFHYDRPNSEPPQVMLLVTPSQERGEWAWADLVEALHETLDLAKQRAVEPAHVENTPLGVFAPMAVFPVAPWAITASLNLSAVNFLNKLSD